MNERAPDCCKNCNSLTHEGYCMADFRTCAKWRAWFREEWDKIRRAADLIKKSKKEDPPE